MDFKYFRITVSIWGIRYRKMDIVQTISFEKGRSESFGLFMRIPIIP